MFFEAAVPNRLDPGLTDAGRPKSAPFGSLPHCQPGSWPECISGIHAGGGNGGGTKSCARGIAIGDAVEEKVGGRPVGLWRRGSLDMRIEGVDDMARDEIKPRS